MLKTDPSLEPDVRSARVSVIAPNSKVEGMHSASVVDGGYVGTVPLLMVCETNRFLRSVVD